MMIFIVNYISINRSRRVESKEISFVIGTYSRMNSFMIHLIIPVPERFYKFYILINDEIHNKLDSIK
jgi:hypothetical protein